MLKQMSRIPLKNPKTFDNYDLVESMVKMLIH